MDKITTESMGVSPKIKPSFTFDSTSSSTSGTNQCDSDCEEARKKRLKMPRRKRKSKSSSGKMLKFLQSYSERREKLETEKLALLKSIKEDKKKFFFLQFHDVLKNK